MSLVIKYQNWPMFHGVTQKIKVARFSETRYTLVRHCQVLHFQAIFVKWFS